MQAKPSTAPVNISSVATAKSVLHTLFAITKEWSLSAAQEQALLGAGRTTFFHWKSGQVRAALEPAVLERASYLLRIYSALEILIPIPERAAKWIHQHNAAPLFGGGTALARMLAGQVGDLKAVADYLDAQRGGDFS